jgi:hypothetical protein
LTSQQLSDDVCVDGFIGVHGPLTQLRQAEEKSEKRDKDENSPASPLRRKSRIFERSVPILENNLGQIGVIDGGGHTAGLPHTSTSM